MTRTWLATLILVVVSALGAARAQPIPEPGVEKDSRDYVIGIEDVLGIVVFGEPEVSLSTRVRPDGKVTVPLVNDITAAGLTPSQVRDNIRKELGKFLREPNVTVIVEEINSFRVHFLGEVNAQGVIQFYRPTRLLQALAAAGGLTEFSKKEITLLRDEFGVEKRIKINYKRLAAGDPGQENIYMKPGDTLLVD